MGVVVAQRQLFMLVVILIVMINVLVMQLQKRKKGHIRVLFLVFQKMGNQRRDFLNLSAANSRQHGIRHQKRKEQNHDCSAHAAI